MAFQCLRKPLAELKILDTGCVDGRSQKKTFSSCFVHIFPIPVFELLSVAFNVKDTTIFAPNLYRFLSICILYPSTVFQCLLEEIKKYCEIQCEFRLNSSLWATFLQFVEVNLLHFPACAWGKSWRHSFLLLMYGLPF